MPTTSILPLTLGQARLGRATEPDAPPPEYLSIGGECWKLVTDPAAIQAAQAAAEARDRANDAFAMAAFAPRIANRPPGAADADGRAPGAGWLEYDPATQLLKQMWRWDGTEWLALPMDPVMVPVIQIGTGTAGDLTADRVVVTGDFVARVAQILQLSVENLVVTEDATIDELVAQAIAAATAEFQTAYIQNLRSNGAVIDEAVIGALATNIITSGLFRTASEGQRIEIDENGIRQYALDPEGMPQLVLEITPTGTSIFTVGGAQIDGDGNLVAQAAEVSSLAVAGRDLAEIVDERVRGAVAHGWTTRVSEWDGSGAEIIRMHVSAPLLPGRRYSVTMDPVWVSVRGGASTVVVAKLLAGTAGEAQVTTSSTRIGAGRFLIGANPNPVSTGQVVGWIDTSSAWFGSSPRDVAFGLTFRGASGTDYLISGYDDPIRVTVRDEGPSMTYTSWTDMDAGTPAGTSGGQDPDTSTPVRRYTKTYNASDAYSWNTSANTLAKSDLVVQGRYPGGVMRTGAWLFPSLTGDLSGATIKSVKLRWYCSHTYYSAGGTAGVWLHGKGARTFSDLPTWIATKNVRKGTWVEVDVPSSQLQAFASGGTRGFGLQTSDTSLQYYVNGRSDAQMVITYEK